MILKNIKVEYFSKGNGKGKIERFVELGAAVTPKIEFIFSNGQCHALAAALHEVLGWAILGEYPCSGEDKFNHHFVLQSPSKAWCTADIHGIRCLDSSKRKASYKAILQWRNRNFLRPNMDFARHYAPMIACELQKHEDALREGMRLDWNLVHKED